MRRTFIKNSTMRLAIGLMALLMANTATAQTIFGWNNTTGTPDPFFDSDVNWSPTGIPGAADTARINQPGSTFDVHWDSLTGNRTVDRFEVFGGIVTLENNDIAMNQFTMTATSGFQVSGVGNKLTVRGLHIEAMADSIAGFNADMTVDGSHPAGTRVTVNGSTIVANAGQFTVESGGTVSDNRGRISADATVTGSGSLWHNTANMTVAEGGLPGTLNILDGARVETGNDGLVADVAGGNGIVNIDGPGSEWEITGELRVANGHDGDINVTGGATLRSNGGVIGDAPGSFVIIDGADSQWINTGSLSTERELSIRGGATVTVTGPVQMSNGSSGRVTLRSGTLIAMAGVTNESQIQGFIGDSTVVGVVTNNSKIRTFTNASLTFADDVTNSSGRLNDGLESGGTTRFEGSYNGGAFNDSPDLDMDGLVVLAGQYHPGNDGPAVTTFTNLSLEMEAANTTFIELGGTTSGDFDRIELFPENNGDGAVEPNLTLAGNLQVDLIGGFTLDAGQSFEIIDFNSAATFTGTFANFAEGDVVLSNNGFDLVISYVGGNGDDVVLTTVATSTPPANDDWPNGTISTTFPISVTGTNVDATVQPGELQLSLTGATVWWFFDAPDDGTVTIDTFGSDFDTQLHIFDGFFSGATVADLNPIVNNDDALSGGTCQSEVTFAVTAGTCYEIRVGGFDNDGGGSGNPAAQGTIMLNGTFEPAGILLGDVNCDGSVNLLDVQPFVELISTGGFSDKADINGDGTVNLLDVGPFVSLLSGT